MGLQSFLSAHYHLSPEIIEDIVEAGEQKVFSKNENILKPYQPSRKVFFVEKGLVKMYYEKDIRSITHSFIVENQFIGRSDVFLKSSAQQNIRYGLMALENDTHIYELLFSNIQSHAQTSFEINRLIQDILLYHLMGFSNRLSNLQFENAQERYEQLLLDQPDIILRAPLGDVASYLGISQQTLSVIRAKIK